MNNEIDLLQIKIERAKEKLPVETQNAIAAVDWRAAILGLREKKGYNFEQLGDLELETELLLCGLTTPEEYPKELQTRMRISKADTDELINEMNNLVFKKIKEELIKNSERKKIFQKSTEKTEAPSNNIDKTEGAVLKSAGIEVLGPEPELPAPVKPIQETREELLKKVENPPEVRPIFAQKLFSPVQIPKIATEHTAETASKATEKEETTPKPGRIDPYRELPE